MRALRLHDRFVTTRQLIDLHTEPVTVIPRGEEGEIIDIDPDNGDYTVRFDCDQVGIAYRGNILGVPVEEKSALGIPLGSLSITGWRRPVLQAMIATVTLGTALLGFGGYISVPGYSRPLMANASASTMTCHHKNIVGMPWHIANF